jgi:chaperonin cofactor prefoldin
VDEGGVALAAIQGLNEKVEMRNEKVESRMRMLEAENAELKRRLEALEEMISKSKPTTTSPKS